MDYLEYYITAYTLIISGISLKLYPVLIDIFIKIMNNKIISNLSENDIIYFYSDKEELNLHKIKVLKIQNVNYKLIIVGIYLTTDTEIEPRYIKFTKKGYTWPKNTNRIENTSIHKRIYEESNSKYKEDQENIKMFLRN